MRWSINCWNCWKGFPESFLKEEQAAKDNSLVFLSPFLFLSWNLMLWLQLQHPFQTMTEHGGKAPGFFAAWSCHLSLDYHMGTSFTEENKSFHVLVTVILGFLLLQLHLIPTQHDLSNKKELFQGGSFVSSICVVEIKAFLFL